MKSLHKSVLIRYSPEAMFSVVTDVARYPEFLPWCGQSRVIESTPHGMRASIGLALAGFKQDFTTQNQHIRKGDGGLAVQMELLDGPFSTLSGTWSFDPIEGSHPPGCKVTLDLNYEMKSALLQMAIGSKFDKIASSLVDAFVERAKQLDAAA